MANPSQRSNKVTLTVEYDAAQWNALTPEDRQRTIDALHQAVNNLPAATVSASASGNEWTKVSDQEFIREDGYRVAFRSDFRRWYAFGPDGHLAYENPRTGMVAGHDFSAQKVMDTIDAGWPLDVTVRGLSLMGNPVRHCVACGRKHPLLQERKERGEVIPTHEYTCALAIKQNITYEEAAR